MHTLSSPLCLLPVLALTGCLINTDLYNRRRAELLAEGDPTSTDGGTPTGTAPIDADSDGHSPPEDCDDSDPTVHPGAEEGWLDDGVDNNCDGVSQEAMTWTSSEATTMLLGEAAGDELGRRMGWWEEGSCLLVASTFAAENAGRVYALPAGSPGTHEAASLGWFEGPSSYSYLANAVALRSDGVALLAAPAGADGAGAAWLVDAEAACAGGRADVSEAALFTIQGTEVGEYLGANAHWLPDLDGDGVQDLVVISSTAAGGAGEAVFVFSSTLTGDTLTASDADVVVRGEHDGSGLSAVHAATTRSGTHLLFAQAGHASGSHAVARVPIESLRSGSVDDLMDGAIVSYSPDAAWLEVLGDVNNNGGDDFIGGVWTWSQWEVGDLEGTFEEDAATTTFTYDEDGEWLTGFASIGDADGDGLGDFVMRAEDWPAQAEQGAMALVTAADLTPAKSHDFRARRLHAQGAEAGDSFAYRVLPVGDFDGDGRKDLAVSSYGSDTNGWSSGAVIFMPLPY
mgnify:CR=1 FL=1